MPKMIYVAGPYSGKTKEEVKRNIHEAELLGQQLLDRGVLPIIPHKITSFWDEWGALIHWTHADWLEKFCFPLIDRCDGILMAPGWEFSVGSLKEIEYAEPRNVPIYFHLDEVPR